MKNTKEAGIVRVYFFEQLNDDAKEKAREWYKEGNDYPLLKEDIKEFIAGKLEDAGYDVEDLKVLYSLSYCQGDGVSFTATLLKGNERYEVNQSGLYVHEMTMRVYHEDENGNETDEPAMLEEMRAIAKKATKIGYNHIENEDSDENVDDNIIINEYTFTSEGKRLDAEND